jgi:DHA3 family macrolide efflux protein-like MFS transporter
VTASATAIAPLGLVVAGPFADALGPRSWYVLTGAVGILMGLAGFFIPALVHLEDRPAALGAGQPGSEARPYVPGEIS